MSDYVEQPNHPDVTNNCFHVWKMLFFFSQILYSHTPMNLLWFTQSVFQYLFLCFVSCLKSYSVPLASKYLLTSSTRTHYITLDFRKQSTYLHKELTVVSETSVCYKCARPNCILRPSRTYAMQVESKNTDVNQAIYVVWPRAQFLLPSVAVPFRSLTSIAYPSSTVPHLWFI